MKYSQSKEVVCSLLEEELIILNLTTGEYFSFKGLERAIWESLDRPISIEDLLQKISALYELNQASEEDLLKARKDEVEKKFKDWEGKKSWGEKTKSLLKAHLLEKCKCIDNDTLTEMLKELEADGSLQRGRGKRFAEPGALPEVTVLHITGVDSDGELMARPESWDEDAAGPKHT